VLSSASAAAVGLGATFSPARFKVLFHLTGTVEYQNLMKKLPSLIFLMAQRLFTVNLMTHYLSLRLHVFVTKKIPFKSGDAECKHQLQNATSGSKSSLSRPSKV
jgi:hypothetical protein